MKDLVDATSKKDYLIVGKSNPMEVHIPTAREMLVEEFKFSKEDASKVCLGCHSNLRQDIAVATCTTPKLKDHEEETSRWHRKIPGYHEALLAKFRP